MKITEKQLRALVRKKLLAESSVRVLDTAKGLPSASSLAASLSDLDPATAMSWISGLMSALDFSAPEVPEAEPAAEVPPPPPEPVEK